MRVATSRHRAAVKTVAIVNPRAAGGRAGPRLETLTTALRPTGDTVEVRATAHAGHATTLAREALAGGADRVIAIGGDGTVHEVVNGFFEGDTPIGGRAELAILELGTGGDFRRTFDLPRHLTEGVARIVGGTTRPIDVGRATWQTPRGAGSRYFANIASTGLSASVAVRVNAAGWLKRHAGPAAFAWAGTAAILAARPVPVRLTIDGATVGEFPLALCAVCNGRYFGGAMHVAPMATPDDGWLDVVMVEGKSRLELLGALRDVFSGAHIGRPFVHTWRSRTVRLEATDRSAVPVELDGETPGGALPVEMEVIPRALMLRA